MKILKDRQEIAQAINGHKMPVIVIDLADSDWYGLKSKPVLIDNGKFNDGFPFYVRCEVRAYSDERKFVFSGMPVCVSASFDYYDFKEMLDYRNAPIVKADEDVIISIIDSRNKSAYAPMVLHSGKRVNPHCSSPLYFEDNDYKLDEFFKEESGSGKEKKE